jgi:hypothetical protein
VRLGTGYPYFSTYILPDNVVYPQHQWIFLRSVHVCEGKNITRVKTKMSELMHVTRL